MAKPRVEKAVNAYRSEQEKIADLESQLVEGAMRRGGGVLSIPAKVGESRALLESLLQQAVARVADYEGTPFEGEAVDACNQLIERANKIEEGLSRLEAEVFQVSRESDLERLSDQFSLWCYNAENSLLWAKERALESAGKGTQSGGLKAASSRWEGHDPEAKRERVKATVAAIQKQNPTLSGPLVRRRAADRLGLSPSTVKTYLANRRK